ncbi:MAG: hypothetical protein ACM3PU_11400 [Gemmatimonadota bacterium]
MNRTGRWIAVVVVLLLAMLAWADDFVTLQGEHTIYTVHCEGSWSGTTCAGRLAAADRYRFRALRARREVIFWVAGSPEPSGKFTGCEIRDGRNWSCKPSPDAARSITLALVRGKAQHDATGVTRAFHAISKWKWWWLRAGLGTFKRASY